MIIFEDAPLARRDGPASRKPVDPAQLEAHKVFRVEEVEGALVVVPQGDSARFHYADVQTEADTIVALIEQRGPALLVIDFGQARYFGSVTLGLIVCMARRTSEGSGKAALCNAGERTLEILKTMKLMDRWAYFATREEAVKSLAG